MENSYLPQSQVKVTKIDFYKPTLSKEELKTVLECLVEDQLYTGAIVNRFEKEFRSTFQLKHTTSANSLMAAYHLSLIALGITEGSSVILSSLAPLQALDAILLLKANPIVVDIGKSSFLIDPENLKKKLETITPNAILIDHTFGCLMDWTSYGVSGFPIVEDFSEAVGADSERVPVGKIGTISICGLAENHVITTGNGAMIHTADAKLAESIKQLKFHTNSTRVPNQPKFDYDLIDYQAAIGIEQLSKLGLIIERKKKIAQVYLQAIVSSSHESYFKKPNEEQFNRFPVIISKSYEEVKRYFDSLQIETKTVTPQPIHKILGLPTSDYPNAERIFQRGHCIPIYPNLTRDNVSRIASALRGIF